MTPVRARGYSWQESGWDAVLLPFLLVAVFALYAAAFGTGYHFDDSANLSGLARVTDLPSALTFAFGGEAGPLGRPLALLTFAAQASYWPSNPEDIVRFNVLLHLINGTLVALGSYWVARLFPRTVERPATLALGVSAFWLVQPLLVSTSLMGIQRMTSLSATAVFSGLLLYIAGRGQVALRPRLAFSLMTLGLAWGTLLGVLSKENGILMPLLAWTLEATLLRAAQLPSPRWFAVWKLVVFLGTALLLAAYAVVTWDSITQVYLTRTFTLGERLVTQSVVLWDYLRQTLVPDVLRLGPFQDDYAAIRPLSPLALTAMVGWIATGYAAVVMRRKAPLLSFAIAWFLVGHLIESTVWPLELYFEHRNYLPSLGPIALVVGGVALAGPRVGLAAKVGLTAYGITLLVVLYQLTSLWGQPTLAAEVWAQQHPRSPRAIQYLTRTLLQRGETQRALRVLTEAAERLPTESDLAMQVLQTHCGLLPSDAYKRRAENVQRLLPTLRYSNAALDALQRMTDMAREGECLDLTRETVGNLTRALLENPAFLAAPAAVHHLHHGLARLAFDRRDLSATMAHLEQAFYAYPNAETGAMMVATLVSAGLHQKALAKLAEVEERAPYNPVLRAHWRGVLGEVRGVIDTAPRGGAREG